ncbi:hypothetical protein KVF89_12585 [Nocardioides carbamazepini]|uniref:hypothetical protein n=1 Tax=Nocardioides carbamazepini TaxID=2854259 RepID=UPI00214A0D4E|nr:hypothetical protein [Nocardioides carbamazepini]MCR1783373.1 hypothetical protein [Nocardioides carbamazepini]
MHRSSPRVALALLLSLLVAGATVALAAPAQADRWTYDDAAGDVTTQATTDTSITVTPLPEQANGDIVQVTGTHKARKVSITMRMRAPLTGPFMISAMLRVPGNRFMVMSPKMPGFSSTELMEFSMEDDARRCRGIKRTVGADRMSVRIAIPRSCLGNPRWFKFGAVLTTVALFTDASYDDDALATGMTLYGMPAMSPKIKR